MNPAVTQPPSAPPDDPEQTDFERVSQLLEIAAHYHQTVNMFYHPVYIARSPACRAAIDELLRQVRERNLTSVHVGSDALYHWWEARSRSGISEWEIAGSALRFRARCAAPEGMVVQVPLDGDKPKQPANGEKGWPDQSQGAASVDGQPAVTEIREEFGQRWLCCVLPAGEHDVKIEW